VFNISLGNEFANMFHAPQPPVPALQAIPALPFPQSPTLIPLDQALGVDMLLSNFCVQFGLNNNILEKLTNNGFNHTCTLHFHIL